MHLLLTLLQASINSLRASGVDIQPQVEERVESVQGLIKHLQERAREGTLRSDRDTYALLPTGGNNRMSSDILIPCPQAKTAENCHTITLQIYY